MRWLSRLVTVTVILAIIGGGVLFLRSKVPTTTIGGTFMTYAKFRDGSRFAVGSPVVVAGVRVGDIAHLSIDGPFARVDLRIKGDVKIPVDSFVTRRSDSLFGDSYIEIILGGGEGAANIRYLQSGEPLTHVIEGGSTDAVLRAIDRSLPKIDNALELVHDAMSSGRKFIDGPALERMNAADRWLSTGKIESPLTIADKSMIRLEDRTTRGADALAEAAPTIKTQLARFDAAISSARASMRDARTGLVAGLHDAREGMDRIDPTVAQMSEVMTAIKEGHGDDWKGTLGRLVNSPEVADTLEDATEAGRDATASFDQFKAWLGVRVEYNFYGAPRIYATAEVNTRTDKFYLVEIEKGNFGGVPSDTLTENPGTGDFTRRQQIREAPRFTFQFGKHLGALAVRGGIKDSTVGFGSDAYMISGRLKLSADLLGSFKRVPRLKVAAAFAVFRSLWVIAGVDDALNPPGQLNIITGNSPEPGFLHDLHYGRDYFLGATLQFTDADLSTLLRVYGALVVGALVR
jgi:hypothetical protein